MHIRRVIKAVSNHKSVSESLTLHFPSLLHLLVGVHVVVAVSHVPDVLDGVLPPPPLRLHWDHRELLCPRLQEADERRGAVQVPRHEGLGRRLA